MKSVKKNVSREKNLKKAEAYAEKSVLFLLLLILAGTFVAYLPVLRNGFVNWDETSYILNNPLIRQYDLRKLFTTFQLGNYHPLTMLVYTIQYHLWGYNETGYHAVSLAIHLLNVVLVYFVIMRLSNNISVALVASLLFGIHPLHVESVAWAAELKDLLYTFFYLSSLCFYLEYVRSKQTKYYHLSFTVFILSLLSKGMAVSLPLVLLLVDFYKERKPLKKLIAEKIPFLMLSVGFGILAIVAQGSSESIQEISKYPLYQRLIFACFGFVGYIFKTIIPSGLSAFYPYPIKSGEALPAMYYLNILILIAIVWLVVNSLRRTKKLAFGILFYSITVFLVLQLLPVGDAIMADRYSYIPSIGIFFLAGEGFLLMRRRNLKLPAILLLVTATIVFAVQTNQRCRTWKDPVTLWTDVIEKNKSVAFAYNNRGGTFMNQGRNEEAMSDFNKALGLRTDYADALNNRGILLLNLKKYDAALTDFDAAIRIKPGLSESFNNRGLAKLYLERYNESRNDFNRAIRMNPGYDQAYYNRGLLSSKEGRNSEAYDDYSKAISLNENYTDAYVNRGVLFHNEKRYEEALRDYEMALKLSPNNPQAKYNISLLPVNGKNLQK